MSRNKRLKEEVARISTQAAAPGVEEDALDPSAQTGNEPQQEDEIEDIYADQDKQPDGKTPEDDPLEALQRQYDEIKAAKDAAESRLREREAAETRLKSDYDQERRTREQAEIARQEAEERWRQEQRRRADIEKENLVQHKAVLEHAIAAAKGDVDTAKRTYAEAMTNMDYAAAAEAQEKLAEAKYQISKLTDGYEVLQERIAAPAPEPEQRPQPRQQQRQPSPDEQWEAAIAGYGERDKQWLRKNKQDLLSDPARQQMAQAADVAAVNKHKLTRGSDDYYAFLDDFMGYAPAAGEQQARQQQTGRQPAAPRRPPVSAAPVSRANMQNGGAALPYLTAEQKQMARALGMSFARYAQWDQKIKDGQTHLRYIHEGN